ncbi:MAG: tRNA (adenosine(37)-N6)-threonylcarbamoyltransferase complex ATPase subunit type 1 TsaE [Nitrospira sp.]|nr:tRNA (adenosine(37)-N6)-threonylcarbamoyltransferase complex ATPase subunit type 1 TsaE [Nitrospira sp.]
MKPNRARSRARKSDQVRKAGRRAAADSPEVVLTSLAATESLGRAIGRALTGGNVLALIGGLGAGKTSMVRGIATGLDAPPDSVSSPTFVLVHEYRARLPLIHVDLYRLHSDADIESIGLTDYFTDRTVVAIEWADRFPALLPEDRLEVWLTHRSPATRIVRFTAKGPHSRSLLARIDQARRLAKRPPASQTRKTTGPRKASTR